MLARRPPATGAVTRACVLQLGRLQVSPSVCCPHTRVRGPSARNAQSKAHTLCRSRIVSETGGPQRVVFLGTPSVAAGVLSALIDAEGVLGAKVVAAVTSPAKRQGRGKILTATPVEVLARDRYIPHVLTPVNARDPVFLESVRSLNPDLCVTAAYGHVLPEEFLEMPRLGTLNIHPSLLPSWRGAAPVQRSIEAGDPVTGVSVAYTVYAMDAGPIAAQVEYAPGDDEMSEELLKHLFTVGTDALISDVLPRVFSGTLTQASAVLQDEAKATKAKKLRKEEGFVNFASCEAAALHNKVRAFAGWPGTSATFDIGGESFIVKIMKTRKVVSKVEGLSLEPGSVTLSKQGVFVTCGEGTVVELIAVQPPNKKVINASDWVRGMQGKTIKAVETTALAAPRATPH